MVETTEIKKTQHYSYKYKELLKGLNIPKEAIDPFAGDGVLANISKLEMYDIQPKNENVIKRDTLLNPLDYTNKWILTNPPYLAKNKTKSFKNIFEIYKLDDLYKCAISSIIGCSGGCLIIPVNFFTDEDSKDIRLAFLSKYKILNINFFDKPMFDDTTYSVCAFDFIREDNISQNIKKYILEKKYNYRLGGDWYYKYNNIVPLFKRAMIGEKNVTNIYLQALDTRSSKIHLEYREVPYYSKNTDRIKASLVCQYKLLKWQEEEIIRNFNSLINNSREYYNNLLFSNYRDFGRKRISFELVYKICTYLLENLTRYKS